MRGAVDTTFAQPQASTTDAAGNTYVAVSYKDSLRVGNIRLVGPRNFSQALLKYDATGAVLWAKALNYIQNIKLTADNSSAGGVFVVAIRNSSTPTWGGVAVPIGNFLSFYAKCTPNGTLQWAYALPAGIGTSSMGADNAGNLYIAGAASANATVGGTVIFMAENYVLKTDGTGAFQWVRTMHMTTASFPMTMFNVVAKPAGGCLIGGIISGMALYLGSGSGTLLIPNRAGPYGFLTTFDAAGAHQWSQAMGTVTSTGTGFAAPSAVAADANGNCYAGGSTTGALQIGGVTLNSGFYLAKYDATGAVLWVRDAQTPNSSSNVSQLVVGTSGPTAVVYAPVSGSASLNVGTLALRSLYSFVHFNDQGMPQWAVGDTWPNRIGPYFLPSGLGIDGQDNLYTVGRPSDLFNNFSAIQLGAQTTVGKGTIVARLNAYANTLRGQVYLDQNGNGQQDTGEGIFPRPLTAVLTQGGATIYSATGTDGILQAYAGSGAYTLALAQVPARYTVSQPSSGSYTGTFSSNQLVTGQNFGVAPIANQADIRITLTPYSTARPGFTTSYRVSIENTGTTTVTSGTATVVLDSHFTYISSSPSASRTGQTLTWNYANLAPFGQLSYDVLVSLPTNTVVGTALSSTATALLTGDVEPTDNTSTLAQTVVASYDPNSMEVNYERITPTQVAAQQWLEYTIHFQNLGTAAAVNVILSDTLDYDKLNPASLQWITQSHNCIWSLTSIGPNTGLLTVRFLGINLPERNVDVIRSQGFVRFRVRARPTLAVGEIIPNHAGIVFDYNSAVITNTATTTVFVVTAALGHRDAAAWDAYPNPATNVVTIAADLATAGPVRVELLDVLGRPVRQQSFTAPAGPLRQALNLQGLAAGVYVLRLTPPTGPASSRQVVLN
ncbi:T9SS type A sorting domain-containing protein [Hymenobacter negativus]|uniref:T9SS type A sorting domain-containing protein n=1 Tax=Hymenobacter negativus TaxID=2795026 RepID=UPI001AAFA0C9|nr:T9SS type A sorting domain-containing protein [Hymenobacter negativus]